MAKPFEPYLEVVVESYRAPATAGLHGSIHVRPIPGQVFSPSLRVQCSKNLSRDYPVGTKFRIRVKLTDKEARGEFLYSSYRWPVEVLA